MRLGALLPRGLRLPCMYFFQTMSGWEPECKHIDRLVKERGLALDIGANQGLYSYRLHQLFREVHAFEANEGIAADLIAFRARNVRVHVVGLSDKEGSATLYVPEVKGRQLHGWASLDPGNCADADRVVSKNVLLTTLDTFELRGVDFIKIDVEGHELAVLRGAEETLRSCLPRLLIEIRADTLPSVIKYLSAFGYQQVDDLGLSPGNYFFVAEDPSVSLAATSLSSGCSPTSIHH